MDISEYLMSQRDTKDFNVINDISFLVAKRIICVDGFSISVQATHGAYCSPRTNIGPWYEVECGYPTSEPLEIMRYIECVNDDPTKSVYAYVPVNLVEKLIDSHGGMV